MICDDFSEPIKSCSWQGFWQSYIPRSVLISPEYSNTRIFKGQINNIRKEFDVFVVKCEKKRRGEKEEIRIGVFQYPLERKENSDEKNKKSDEKNKKSDEKNKKRDEKNKKPDEKNKKSKEKNKKSKEKNKKSDEKNEKPDDGYALRFWITINGFYEETKSAIMMHDDEQVGAFFTLTDDVLKKARSAHVFDVFVVVQMLEFRSLDSNDPRKIKVDQYISDVRKFLGKKKKIKQLGCILRNPKLEDVFTGRLPVPGVKKMRKILEHLDKLAEYFEAKYNDKDFEAPVFERNNLFYYLGMSEKEGQVSLSHAIIQYLLAHHVGFDCFKTAASSYLEYLLIQDCNIMHILEKAIMVHDEDLVEIAAHLFVKRLHEIKRSEIYKKLCVQKPSTVRLIVHRAIMWVNNNDDIYFPGWGQTVQPTTEL